MRFPVQETWVRSLGQEDPLEKKMATHSSILAWRIPWTEEPGKLQSMGLQSQTQLSNQTVKTTGHSASRQQTKVRLGSLDSELILLSRAGTQAIEQGTQV